MNTDSDGLAEQRRVIDVNAVDGDHVAAQLKDVDEWNADHRTIVARIGHLSLTNRGPSTVPRAQQPVPAERNGREKTRRSRVDGLTADDHRSIAKAKLRIWSEEANKTSRVTGVDDCEYTLPPREIGLKDFLGCYSSVHRVVGYFRFSCVCVESDGVLHSILDAMTVY